LYASGFAGLGVSPQEIFDARRFSKEKPPFTGGFGLLVGGLGQRRSGSRFAAGVGVRGEEHGDPVNPVITGRSEPAEAPLGVRDVSRPLLHIWRQAGEGWHRPAGNFLSKHPVESRLIDRDREVVQLPVYVVAVMVYRVICPYEILGETLAFGHEAGRVGDGERQRERLCQGYPGELAYRDVV
jgi:hypothetical protein